ncbi:uncharacterized protein OCT59_010294 [Rhizophagus irregularis]|uniref:DUF7707 domain-containing protein n=2 Tax=Rhizophagus irregularis TaxID=588596 RepID=A0A015L966_RHIIW|nr:hypothetical protein GLOIN_2v1555171 [Rhizophagus irregularis DAOM 181602=DAOM 197198]EXX76209.1 hypothetical protein RirG_035290 [Rhizophagus irregularis DAOM 197198w]UZO18989.1 hypothetical protein OCT59_010294 [Rhizophagus irregularis]POG76527.1 hypothetical protein GLOIN_2v1555171 [Rhizophagus irregularis DAOM 181602=DAOM 197198]CAG8458929.1 23116_t:CDS:2 [Rhizophagus irregularis]GBC30217.1 hypothetical protein GLOIN_2v1555171 [Rhizophagus irregularis DAOM 181602=DAOM 197198]|eukprot:XP_025183393.1 hypothetical protein GLOIN_2v1555171 [Rhizophagus irregularis DAOM 181602=DAOM 197198]
MKLFATIYIAVIAFAAFSNAQAQNATANLPDFQFLLTQKSEPERDNICKTNMGFCETNCGGPNKAPMNFCNVTTMGWGCGCSDKIPDLSAFQWPINREHCIGSGEACKLACQDPKVPNEKKPDCNLACIDTYTSKCGTAAQPPAYYNVSDPAIVPTYAPPKNSVTDSANNNSTSTNGTNGSQSTNNSASESKKQSSASSINHLGNAAVALVIVASGMSLF